MRGHACKGQLLAIEETRNLQSCRTEITVACRNVKIIALKIFQILPFTNFQVMDQFVSINTTRRGQKFPGNLAGLSRSLRTRIYNTYYDLVHPHITNSTRVCSVHFKEADFQTTLTGKRILEKHAVPSMFCWSRSSRKRKSPKKQKPPRAQVQLFDRSVPSSPATVTGKYCCRYFFKHSLAKIVK